MAIRVQKDENQEFRPHAKDVRVIVSEKMIAGHPCLAVFPENYENYALKGGFRKWSNIFSDDADGTPVLQDIFTYLQEKCIDQTLFENMLLSVDKFIKWYEDNYRS